VQRRATSLPHGGERDHVRRPVRLPGIDPDKRIVPAYRPMAADADRDRDALQRSNGLAADASDEAR
jgi:hypothetical protein